MNKEEAHDEFFARVTLQMGFTKEQAIEILSKKFAGYQISKESQYLAVLREEWINANKKDTEEMLHPPVLKKYPPCPICGAHIVSDRSRYSRELKLPGWNCSENNEHFHQWKVNVWRSLIQEKPIFEEKFPDPIFPVQHPLIRYRKPLRSIYDSMDAKDPEPVPIGGSTDAPAKPENTENHIRSNQRPPD
jgi:hypothetical protein